MISTIESQSLDWYDPFDTKEAAHITPQDNGETVELNKQDQVQIDNIVGLGSTDKESKGQY